MGRVAVTHFNDPAFPFGYSASPALAALQWRYGAQLDWRLVMIGLTDDPDQYLARGYDTLFFAQSARRFRRYGMPIGAPPKARGFATARACRAVVAVGLEQPEREWAAFRALQRMQFTTEGLLDSDDDIRAALEHVPEVDAAAIVSRLDDPDVVAAYERDWEAARTAAGSPAEAQGKTAGTDGPGHGAVADLGGGRAAARRRWLPAARGLRRAAREPGLRARAPAAGRGSGGGAGGVPGRAGDG